jgi:outer membrane protein assembly factor BamB
MSSEPRLHEIIAAYVEAVEAGAAPDRAALLARHPDLAADLEAFFRDHDRMRRAAATPSARGTGDAPTLMPAAARSADPSLGTVAYFGDYELLEEVARGGMGVVYRARQMSLNRIVALKMILAGKLADEEDVRRFRSEAQVAAQLQHPNIVAIHEVGEHQGQHYFSMDFVEGCSLADWVLDGPLPPLQAAGHVEAVARAIHYAHERGVLHRDLKPANILLDQTGQVRVTDFGLARQIGSDKGLTASGAVVGTPSYMPPEQASGRRDRMGPASDVYSLGAVLYELVTGRPPFRAATQLDTLLQVLESEPAPPRLLNPSVNRDLETIVLKCLAKEPVKRYGSAAELADDLQAFREGRPIRARRPGPVERLARWATKNRRGVALAAVAAAASALAVIGSLWGWQRYDERRRGSVTLTTPDDRFCIAEVLDDQDRRVVPTFTVPTEQPVTLLEGHYRVRLSALGFPSETYQLDVRRGRSATYNVGLGDRRPWGPMEMTGDFKLIHIDGRTDILTMADNKLQRTSGATGQVLWARDLTAADQPGLAPDAEDRQALRLLRPLPSQAPDLDGDGFGDLVFGVQFRPELVAISGKDGSALWRHRARAQPADARFDWGGRGSSGLLAEPLFRDVDGDGLPDVLTAVTCEDLELRFPDGRVERPPAEVLIQAVSGRTGKTIWSTRLDGIRVRRYPVGQEFEPFSLTAARRQGRPILIAWAAGKLFTLDLRSGKIVAGPVAVPPVRPRFAMADEPPRFFDPDGSGELAFLSMTGAAMPNAGDLVSQGAMKIAAVSASTGQTLWETVVEGWTERQRAKHGPATQRDWPLPIAAVRGAGQDLLVPFRERERMGRWEACDWHGVERLDGRTGKTVWRRRLVRHDERDVDDPIRTRLLTGPDLNGDGQPEIFVATSAVDYGLWEANKRWAESGFPKYYYPNVVALSGADGALLWHARLGDGFSEGADLDPLFWWQPGADGRPLLVVPLANFFDGSELQAWALDVATGRVRHTLAGLEAVAAHDFDGDGLLDLHGYRPKEFNPRGTPGPGKLHVFRGSAPEAFRKLGDWTVAADFDGDGRRDLLRADAAASSRGGGELWRSDALPKPNDRGRLPPHVARGVPDLDGDGVPDLVVWQPQGPGTASTAPLRAVSGKDGRLLWSFADLKIGLHTGNGPGWSGTLLDCRLLACRDLEGDGRADLLFVHQPPRPSDSSNDLELLALSGRDGSVRWRQRLGGPSRPEHSLLLPAAIADGRNGTPVIYTVSLDGDVLALDGRDGRIVWQARLTGASVEPEELPKIAVGLLSPEGPHAVVVCWHAAPLPGRQTTFHVSAFAADAGKPLWTWSDTDREFIAQRHSLGTPVLAAVDRGRARRVCFLAHTQGLSRLTLQALDEAGRACGRFTFAPENEWTENTTLVAADLLGDGRTELVVLCAGRLFAFRDGLDKPFWTWPLPVAEARVLDVRPGNGRAPATIIVQSGNAVYGIAGPTGKPRWRCDGPGPVIGLLSDGDAGPAAVAFAANTTTVVREALPTDEAGRCVVPEAGPVEGLTPVESPWLARPLPWARKDRFWWDAFALLFAAQLAFLWRRFGWKAGLLGLLALLIGVGVSVAELRVDAAYKHPEQHYALTDWYGMLSNTAAVFGGLLGVSLVLLGAIAGLHALRGQSARRQKDRPRSAGA